MRLSISVAVVSAAILFFGLTGQAFAGEKADIIFVTNAVENDLTVNVSAYNAEKKKFSLSKGFNVIIGQGSALFGPYSLETDDGIGRDLKLQRKSVKPGSYMFVNVIGFGSGSSEGSETACFSDSSKLFTVEADKTYVLTLPNAAPNKAGSHLDWSLEPDMTAEETRAVIEKYGAHKGEDFSDATIIRADKVSFEARMKFGNCRTPKSHAFNYINEEDVSPLD